MRLSILVAVLSLAVGGCAKSYRDCSLYSKSGSAKPIVAVLPVIDNSHAAHMKWDLSEELTDKIQRRISNSAKLYVLKNVGDREIASLFNAKDPSQVETLRSELGATEFAIVTELVDQNEFAYSHPKAVTENKPYLEDIGGKIHLTARVRLIDLRNEAPKVILQEVIALDHEISRPYMNVDYARAPWGESAYEKTPMGMAHNKLVMELVSHVEGYIQANRG